MPTPPNPKIWGPDPPQEGSRPPQIPKIGVRNPPNREIWGPDPPNHGLPPRETPISTCSRDFSSETPILGENPPFPALTPGNPPENRDFSGFFGFSDPPRPPPEPIWLPGPYKSPPKKGFYPPKPGFRGLEARFYPPRKGIYPPGGGPDPPSYI